VLLIVTSMPWGNRLSNRRVTPQGDERVRLAQGLARAKQGHVLTSLTLLRPARLKNQLGQPSTPIEALHLNAIYWTMVSIAADAEPVHRGRRRSLAHTILRLHRLEQSRGKVRSLVIY